MTFTISNIAPSLAAYLAPYLPGVTFYEDPNQQGTVCPCMFLQARGASKIENRLADRYLRTIRMSLTYLEDYNLPDLQRRYQAAAEVLDEVLETFPYIAGEESRLLRTYNREEKIDLDALHYDFELRIWVMPGETDPLMETLAQSIDAEP